MPRAPAIRRLQLGKKAEYLTFLFLFVGTLCITAYAETQVRWESNVDPNDPAQTAPRSQKYWDEHNIERPDYAKTDAELALEGRKEPGYLGVKSLLLLLLLSGIVGYWFLFWHLPKGSHRLGREMEPGRVRSPVDPAGASDVDGLRQVRLARFEENSKEE